MQTTEITLFQEDSQDRPSQTTEARRPMRDCLTLGNFLRMVHNEALLYVRLNGEEF